MNFEQKMSLLKQTTKTSLLISYVQFYIQSQYYHKELIPEQNTDENSAMYQLILDPCIMSLSALYTDQYSDTLPTS
jgi:hypothetical protein